MKFPCLLTAENYVNRAFETTGTSYRIVMYDFPFYMVCTPRKAAQLVREGYDLV